MTAEDRVTCKQLREQAMRSLIECLRAAVVEEMRMEWLRDMVTINLDHYRGKQWTNYTPCQK